MKKLALFGCFILVASALGDPAEATILGNPSARLNQGQVAVGAEYAFGQKDTESGGETDELESHRIVGTISYGFHERIEGTAKVGAGKIDSKSDDGSVSDFEGDFKPSFGGALKVTLYEQEINPDSSWNIGAMGQYMRVESEDTILVSGTNVDAGLDINEWYAAAGASYTHKNFTPYGGVYLNFIDGEATVRVFGLSASAEFEEDELFGIFLGLDYEIFENVTLGVEGRLIDQATIAGAVSYTF